MAPNVAVVTIAIQTYEIVQPRPQQRGSKRRVKISKPAHRRRTRFGAMTGLVLPGGSPDRSEIPAAWRSAMGQGRCSPAKAVMLAAAVLKVMY
jgi:hypothetical protein